MIGQTLSNRYKITDRIGKGAMGTVYRASDTQGGRDVALKIISSELAIDPEMLERFKREGEALSKLKHPNIVGYLDAFQHDDQNVIVMEYVPGGSLYDLIKSGPLPIDRARQIALDLCDALIRAHRLNIIHRDLKPENILLDEDGTPKLADFGVARLTEGTRMTRTGTKVGTPYYMAPEAWKGEKVDAQADIWSLGVILYEMLAGKVPFDGDSEFTIMTKICTIPPPDLKKLRTDVPAGLLKIISRMLTREKERRYQTTRQVAVDLESGERVTSPKATKPRTIIPPKFRASSGRIGLFILLGILAMGGLLFVRNRESTITTPTATEDQATARSSSTAEIPVDIAASAEAISTCEPAGTEPVPFPAGGKSVTGALLQEPDLIVPYFTQIAFPTFFVTPLTLVGLGEWDDQNNLVPELAREIPTIENGSLSIDGLTITWRLKDCLFWSDGMPLTSADVKFTWEAVMDPGNTPASRTGYEKIESIETPDDLTVILHFRELYAPWQTLFTQGPYNSGAILPKHILEGQIALESNDFIRQPTVGSGPFIITEWVPGESITLLPNPNFYAGRAKLDRMEIRFVADSPTALTALQSSDVDWYPGFSENDIESLKELEPNISLTFVPSADFEHYLFNLGRTDGIDGRGKADNEGFCPFKDIRVRKAITLGINRQAILDNILGGFSIVPISQWLNSAWTNNNLILEQYDPEAAATLLDAAGYSIRSDGVRVGNCGGVQTRLSFNFETTPAPFRVNLANEVQSDLAEIGIEFNPIHTAASTFFASYVDNGPLATGRYDMAGYTNGFYPDPYTDSFQCESIPNPENPDGNNWYHNCDPFLSDLIDSSLNTADPVARKTILDEAQKHIAENYYVVILFARGNIYGSNPRFFFGPFGPASELIWNAENWDVK
jgi:ABC-type transport system substrate-binding protein/predicted Ser/Thr protein kinase